MNTHEILAAIASEIARLTEARSLLSDVTDIPNVSKPGRGLPKGSQNAPAAVAPKKRGMSDEGKARIAAAQKKRWATVKKAAKASR